MMHTPPYYGVVNSRVLFLAAVNTVSPFTLFNSHTIIGINVGGIIIAKIV